MMGWLFLIWMIYLRKIKIAFRTFNFIQIMNVELLQGTMTETIQRRPEPTE